jgi:hypothetical protein
MFGLKPCKEKLILDLIGAFLSKIRIPKGAELVVAAERVTLGHAKRHKRRYP